MVFDTAKQKTSLRYWREQKMYQSELADALGINRSYVSQWENGHSQPTRETMERISEILEIPIRMLFVI